MPKMQQHVWKGCNNFRAATPQIARFEVIGPVKNCRKIQKELTVADCNIEKKARVEQFYTINEFV